MKRLVFLAPILLLAGCASTLKLRCGDSAVSRARQSFYLERATRDRPFPGLVAPDGTVAVEAQIRAVSHPRISSPTEDDSTAVLAVAAGSVPKHPQATEVRLRFNRMALLPTELKPGGRCRLAFTREGRFFDLSFGPR